MKPLCPSLTALLLVLSSSSSTTQDAAQPATIRFGDPLDSYSVPFFPGTQYDAALQTPDQALGQRHGSRLASHAEILSCFRAWAATSDRLSLHSYGRTHEGRELVYALISAPRNHARMAEIQADLGRLQDPRGVDRARLKAIVSQSPAVAWMGYSIHGDELSGADASLAVGYQLVAGQGAQIEQLLNDVVVVLDPCMNPDGRERIRSMVEQSAGYTPNLDYASMQRGRWPFGRGNHYLFDMNRDWMAGTQPETRGRWKVAQAFHPQLFVDAHEMESLDTFLFYPQNRPINEQMPPDMLSWQRKYAEGTAQAFDQRGWSYYTREWADSWAPFYSDAWGSLIGATGMLYEQAGISGFPLRRASGEILTYREAVHHQAVASLSNLETLAREREPALQSYLANGLRAVAAETPGNGRMLVIKPGSNAKRLADFRRILDGQEIEYSFAKAAFQGTESINILGDKSESQRFPAGSLVIQARQPRAALLKAFLEFDPRMQHLDLVRERESVEAKGFSKLYDATSWSLPLCFNLDAYWCDAQSIEAGEVPAAGAQTRILGSSPAVAWVIPGADDSALAFAVRAMEAGLKLSTSDTELPIVAQGERLLSKGSLLLRAVENSGDVAQVEAKILAAARASGTPLVYRLGTQLTPDKTSPDTPDLGGGHFSLLARPRVAMLAGAPVSTESYGHLWHHLDTEVGVPLSLLSAHELGDYDLRRYNVLILPPGGLSSILQSNKEALETWVRGGGTLIACANSAAALSAGELGLSSISLRRDALENLAPFALATSRARASRSIAVLDAEVWGDEPVSKAETGDLYEAVEVPEAHDEWLRKFNPAGVMLRAELNPESWLTYGAEGEMPVYFDGSSVFLNDGDAETAVQLAPAAGLRVGGLLWPEARERIADSAWLTREKLDSGQIILFAAVPSFRGYLKATARLFANAVVLGPGLGASQPEGW